MDKNQALKDLVSEIIKCRRCPLYKTATQAVPGEGNPEAKIMFIGEGPGFYEDQLGRPFVGQAGKLLDKLLDSIKLDRKEIFIGNVVKHRPPENRDPQPSEIEACYPWLDEQIKIINPEIIVTLGRFSLNKFIPNGKITQIHGHPSRIGDRIIMPMFHPAAGLRDGTVLHQLEEDFLKIPGLLKGVPETEDKDGANGIKETHGTEDNSNQMELF